MYTLNIEINALHVIYLYDSCANNKPDIDEPVYLLIVSMNMKPKVKPEPEPQL